MNKTLGIAAIVLVAVIMGMSVMAPALAVGPPADPPEGPDLPEGECEDLPPGAPQDGCEEAEGRIP